MEASMSRYTYHHNKENGDTYVYESSSYWDKEKKAPRTRQTYLGKLDKVTGDIIPTNRKKKIVPLENDAERPSSDSQTETLKPTVKVAGPYLLLETLAAKTGLDKLLAKCFPQMHTFILSLVFFIVQKGLPLSRSEAWSLSHLHPAFEPFSSQRISELLQNIREDDQRCFLSQWLRKVAENDCLCYDITSISSYAKGNEYVRFGYNRDGEPLPQVNLALFFGQNSGLPAYYRRLPGKISDVATLKTTIKTLDLIGAESIHFILDRGFYSQSNVDEMLARHHHFTMAVPSGRKWVESIIDQYHDSIASPQNYIQTNDRETLYAATHLHKWGPEGRRTYLHIYFNGERAGQDFDKFTLKMLRYKKEIESGQRVEAHEEDYKRYLIISHTPKRGLKVSFNDAEIQKHRHRYAGFFCLFSNCVKDKAEALNIYRARDRVENSFDDLKNQLDMKRLRVHTSKAMDSRLFLQFLALILISQMRKIIAAHEDIKDLTVREVMENMECIVKLTCSGQYKKVYSETYPIQRKIMDAFELKLLS
jgi:transposase